MPNPNQKCTYELDIPPRYLTITYIGRINHEKNMIYYLCRTKKIRVFSLLSENSFQYEVAFLTLRLTPLPFITSEIRFRYAFFSGSSQFFFFVHTSQGIFFPQIRNTYFPFVYGKNEVLSSASLKSIHIGIFSYNFFFSLYSHPIEVLRFETGIERKWHTTVVINYMGVLLLITAQHSLTDTSDKRSDNSRNFFFCSFYSSELCIYEREKNHTKNITMISNELLEFFLTLHTNVCCYELLF